MTFDGNKLFLLQLKMWIHRVWHTVAQLDALCVEV